MLTYDAVMERASELLRSEAEPTKTPADIGTVAMIVQAVVDLTNAELAGSQRQAGPSGQYVTVKTYKNLKTEVDRLRKEVETLQS